MRICIVDGLQELIPADSYMNTAEYKSLIQQYEDAQKQYNELKQQVDSLPVQYKPESEWDDLERLMYDEFGDKPKIEDSDDVKQLKSNLQHFNELMQDVRNQIQSIKRDAARYRSHRSVDSLKSTSKRDFKGFTTATTGTSFGDEFLDADTLSYLETRKGITAFITEMSPIEYLERCADLFDSTVESMIFSTDNDLIYKYAEMMKSGVKFHMPWLNYVDAGQEGRHRAQAAFLAGIKTMPVLIITEV